MTLWFLSILTGSHDQDVASTVEKSGLQTPPSRGIIKGLALGRDGNLRHQRLNL